MFGKLFQTILISFLFLGSISAQENIIIRPKMADKPLPFGLTEKRPDFLPKIGLALSGGGARGFAQIGVLKALKENNIYIDLIAGTSMGSIIGGLYASGYSLEQIDSIMVNTDWNSMFLTEDASRNELYVEQKVTEDRALFELRLNGLKPILPNSLIAGQKVANFINLLALNAPINIYSSFDDLVYDYKAVCTDLVSGDAIVFDNGTLAQAMRASSSVTLLLPPVKKDSMLLVDGGLVANIPTKIVKENNADIIIAVNTTSPLRDRNDLNYPWNYADQIVSIPMSKLNAEQLQMADVVIKPVADTSRNTDFAHAQNLIDAGYLQATSLISIVQNMIKSMILHRDTVYFGNKNFQPISENANEIALASALNKYDYVNQEIVEFELFKIVDKDDFKNIEVIISNSQETFWVKIDGETNPKINGVFVSGCSLVNQESIENLYKGLVFSPWNSKKVLEFALNILREYRSNGYSLSKIVNINFTKEGQLIIEIDEGIINSVNVIGNTKTNKTVITREFPFENGDVFEYKNALDGLTNLRSTNLFEDFEIEIDSKNDITLRVLEKPSSVLRFGLRIDNEYQTQMAFDIRDENIFGTGTDLGLIAWGGLRNRVYSIEHRANRIFDTYLTYKIRGFYEFQDINTYIYKNTADPQILAREKEGEYRQIYYGVSIGVGTQVQKFGNIIIEAKYHVNEVKNKDNFLGQVYKTDIFSLRFGFSIDSQDKYPFPNSGFLVKSYYETAQKFLGADLSYSKLYIDYKSYFKFGNYSNISPRIQFGFADETLPLSQQFSMGGQYSFFGYREFEFRGRQKLVASLEYRFHLPVKLFFDTYIKARYDLGSIWASREQIRFKDLKHGIGLSLSFDTPIGPAEFAVGKSFIFRNTLSDNQIASAPASFYFRIGYYY